MSLPHVQSDQLTIVFGDLMSNVVHVYSHIAKGYNVINFTLKKHNKCNNNNNNNYQY